MGLIRAVGYAIVAGAIFYGGVRYERSHAKPIIEALEAKIEQQDTIDHKVLSLMVAQASTPLAVERTFQKYDSIVKSPTELRKALEQNDIHVYRQ